MLIWQHHGMDCLVGIHVAVRHKGQRVMELCYWSMQHTVEGRRRRDNIKHWKVVLGEGNLKVFTARAYARAVLGIVILSVCPFVCPSVTRVDCDKTKWRTADILIPYERAITLLLWHQQWLVGDARFRLKFALKFDPPPSKNADFDRFPLITSQP